MDTRDALVLSSLLNIRRTRQLLRQPEAPDDGDQRSGLTPEALLGRLRKTGGSLQPELDEATRRASSLLDKGERLGLSVVAYGSSGYPSQLEQQVCDPPLVLWCSGNVDMLDAPAVAIVGSRAGSLYAREVAGQLGSELASRGVTVVSGLARGVDAAAHWGALEVGGPTVAVLGCGVDVTYPPEHEGLLHAVARAGAVVSELAPGTPPLAFHFPRRNRIISGLSLAVVVVEASHRSGSLITAREAADQGREVMVVPGSVLGGRSRGGHALIKDGAKVVESADDILDEIRPQVTTGLKASPGAFAAAEEEDLLLRQMDSGETYDLDQLAELSGIERPALSARILELELQGRVARLGSGRFSRS